MANAGPGTNGSQFFITHAPTPWLDGRHTIFGEVIKGLDVVDSIATTKTKGQDKPEQEIKINKIDIIKNGKEAQNFNAVSVINNYFTELTKKEEEREAKLKTLKDNFTAEVEKQKAEAKELPSGVKIFMLNKGTGVQPNNNQSALVNYAGYLADGTLFDSNQKEIEEAYGKYNPQREAGGGYVPYPMPYNNKAQLIPGFKEALLTLKIGDKARVFIPTALAYGEKGAGNVIPPNSDLVFDIEITGIADEK